MTLCSYLFWGVFVIIREPKECLWISNINQWSIIFVKAEVAIATNIYNCVRLNTKDHRRPNPESSPWSTQSTVQWVQVCTSIQKSIAWFLPVVTSDHVSCHAEACIAGYCLQHSILYTQPEFCTKNVAYIASSSLGKLQTIEAFPFFFFYWTNFLSYVTRSS